MAGVDNHAGYQIATRAFAVLIGSTPLLAQASNWQLHGLIQGGYIDTRPDTRAGNNTSYPDHSYSEHSYSDDASSQSQPWLQSWLREGTGIHRYDSTHEGALMSQALLELTGDIGNISALNITGFYTDDSDNPLGFSEAFAKLTPLTESWRHSFRLGGFYPQMSLENTDLGWQSRYTYSFSAINSWVAEEMRVFGAEWQAQLPKSRAYQNHKWSLVGSAFINNDGLGTLLAWRGWALHDRQSRFNDRIAMANYPSFTEVFPMQPNWVEPFQETDSKPGFYLGGHWQYRKRSDFRLYYYDNNAKDTEIDSSGQYAWHTRFTSAAWQLRLGQSTRVLAQYMTGGTSMADNMVAADFSAWYLMISQTLFDQHRLSLRYDNFKVEETDLWPTDPNDSDGDAWTLAWRYQAHQHVNLGVEYLHSKSHNQNRSLWDWPVTSQQKQLQINIQLSF